MNDDELLEALRTGLDAADPPPPALWGKAIEAGAWPGGQAGEVGVRTTSDLVGSAMRSGENPDTDDDGLASFPQDLAFGGGGYDISVTIDIEATIDDSVEVAVLASPRLDRVSLVSPFGEPVGLNLDQAGYGTALTALRAVAIEFRSQSGELMRTPLIRLY